MLQNYQERNSAMSTPNAPTAARHTTALDDATATKQHDPTMHDPTIKADDSSATLVMTFTNYSGTSFSLDNYYYDISKVAGVIQQSPGSTLQAQAGVQTLSEYQVLSGFESASADLYTIWYDPSTGWRFGVMIHGPYQLFGIGKAPYWYVMSDTQPVGSEANWVLSGDDASQPYTWPSDIGFKIVATPTAGHTSLSIEIVIQDSSNA
jgi:hypothetical protein